MELGGDCQSTWGTESSYAHTAVDVGWDRGYEWWLAKEAKARNPKIVLATLSWCVPGWVQGGFISPADVDYHVNHLKGAKAHHNLTVDYVGVFNERSAPPDYIIALRRALDAAGFNRTKLVASDLVNWDIYGEMTKNQTLEAAVDVIGTHHLHPFPHPADATGMYATPAGASVLPESPRDPGRKHRALWSSEDGMPGIDNAQPNWEGAITYASLLSSNLRKKGPTATILCPMANCWHKNVGETLHGFLWAREPHSGHFVVGAGLFVGAHWTHHTERGWWYIGGGSFGPAIHSPTPSPAPISPPPAPALRVCESERLQSGSYCSGDHTSGSVAGTGLSEKQCAQACAADRNCSFFEFGCSANDECILLSRCDMVARSGCGNNIDRLVNSSSCPLLPPPPEPDMIDEWDLNGSWVALAPSAGSPTFTIIAETVNAQRQQTVRISLQKMAQPPSKLSVFLTCLNESCAGFPSKLHSREPPVTVGASGDFTVMLEPKAVYTFTTLESIDLARPASPPSCALWACRSPADGSALFQSSFAAQKPQEPGFGLADYYGNFEVSTRSTLRQTSMQPPWPWQEKRADGQPVSIFGTNMQNYAVAASVRIEGPSGSARVCGRVGRFHGGFESMVAWDLPPGVCLTLSVNGSWSLDSYSAQHPGTPLRLRAGVMKSCKSVWMDVRIEFLDYVVSASVGSAVVVANVPLVTTEHGSGKSLCLILSWMFSDRMSAGMCSARQRHWHGSHRH